MPTLSQWVVSMGIRHGASVYARDMAANQAGSFSLRRMVRNWRRNELLTSLNEYGEY